jgi:hypothetical protein
MADTARERKRKLLAMERKQWREQGQPAKETTINLDRQQSSRCYLAAPESREEEKNVDKRRR